MNKSEFIKILRNHLRKFNKNEVDNIILYYDELIEEQKELGISETEAIASFGDIKDIVNKTTADLVLVRSKENTGSPIRNFLIIIGICASPILLPIGISFFAVFFAILAVFIALILAFIITAFALIFSIIPAIIEMSHFGQNNYQIILYTGVILITSGFFMFLAIAIVRIGKVLLNLVNKTFTILIKNKTKGKI